MSLQVNFANVLVINDMIIIFFNEKKKLPKKRKASKVSRDDITDDSMNSSYAMSINHTSVNDEDEDKNPVGKSYNEDTIHELYSVEYKFKSDKDAKAAATFIAKHASPGKLEIDVQKNFVDVYVVGGMHGSGEKELKRAHAEVEKYFKEDIDKNWISLKEKQPMIYDINIK